MNKTHPKLHICPIKMLYLILEQQENPLYIAAILCSDTEIRANKLRNIPYIYERFSDVTDRRQGTFETAQAEHIASFVNLLPEQITDLYVCCDAGESRSAAIAAAIMRYWDMDDTVIWKNPQYHPNTLVYKVQMQAFGLCVTESQCAQRKQMSEEALSNMIRRTGTDRIMRTDAWKGCKHGLVLCLALFLLFVGILLIVKILCFRHFVPE